jgi:Flp pilus assembly pilin Flp
MKHAQLKKFTKEQHGLSAMEYSVLFVIIVVGALALWTKLSRSLADHDSQGDQTFNSALGAANSTAVDK